MTIAAKIAQRMKLKSTMRNFPVTFPSIQLLSPEMSTEEISFFSSLISERKDCTEAGKSAIDWIRSVEEASMWKSLWVMVESGDSTVGRQISGVDSRSRLDPWITLWGETTKYESLNSLETHKRLRLSSNCSYPLSSTYDISNRINFKKKFLIWSERIWNFSKQQKRRLWRKRNLIITWGKHTSPSESEIAPEIGVKSIGSFVFSTDNSEKASLCLFSANFSPEKEMWLKSQ